MKRATTLVAAIVATAAAVAGCREKPTGSSVPAASTPKASAPIAVVNLQKFYAAVGWDVGMKQAMAIAKWQYRQVLGQRMWELAHESEDFRAQVAQQAHLDSDQTRRLQRATDPKQLDDFLLTPAQKQQLVTEGLEIALKAGEANQSYRQQMSDRELMLVTSYGQQIMPIAQRVAEREGFHVVKADGPDILYHDPNTDLTEKVIAEWKKGKPGWEQQPAATQPQS